jgi:hypothetical protein
MTSTEQPQLTQEDVLKRGMKAAKVLSDESLMSFFQEELDLLKQCIVNTQPFESKTRDSLYNQYHALKSFLESLDQYVSAANEIVKASEKLTTEDFDN